MSGDLGSFMSGALPGYGFVDNVFARKNERKRQAVQDERTGNLYKRSIAADDRAIAQQQKAEEIGQIKMGLTRAAAGYSIPEDVLRIMQKPEHAMYWPDNLTSPQVGADIDVLQDAIDPNKPTSFKDPAVLDAFNNIYGPDINSDNNGAPMPGRRVATAIYPGKDKGTFAIQLDVDGTPQPMTERRGTVADGDDNIMQTPVDKAIAKVQGYKAMRKAFDTPEGRKGVKQFMRDMGMMAKSKPVSVARGAALVSPEGEEIYKNPYVQSGGGAGAKVPDYKTKIWGRVRAVLGMDNNTFTPTKATGEKATWIDVTANQIYDAQPVDKKNISSALEMAFRQAQTRGIMEPDQVRSALREIEAAKDNWYDWGTKEPTPEEIEAEYNKSAATPPRVGRGPAQQQPAVQQAAPQSSGPVQIRNADDYNRLPSGTKYIDPNGVERVKG